MRSLWHTRIPSVIATLMVLWGPASASWTEPVNLGPVLNSASFDGHAFLIADGTSLYLDSDRVGGLGNRDIWVSHVIGHTPQGPLWSQPTNLGQPVNSAYFDGHHCLSADNETIYFVSDRPGGPGGGDIWKSVWSGEGWSEPTNLGPPVNSTVTEFTPFLSTDGQTLYFCSNRAGGFGDQDIYRSNWLGTVWSDPENLGPTINTSQRDYCPWVSADNSALYFMSWGHGSYGRADIFMSQQTQTGWETPQNVGPAINSEYAESGPFLTPAMDALYFHSERPGSMGNFDVYVSYLQTSQWSVPINLGPALNTASFDGNMCLSDDGTVLYFDSDRSGGYGNRDIWFSHLIGSSPSGPIWSVPQNIGIPINSDAWDGHVTLTPGGGMLYFVSDRSGGLGGSDIWVTEWTGMTWGIPENLGEPINSTAAEHLPFIANNGQTLYFGSDRPGSYGGRDLYRSDWLGDSWSVPQNLGPTINTPDEENGPWVSPQLDLLFFQSWGHGGYGQVDLFQSTWNGSGWDDVVNVGSPVNTVYREAGACLTPDMGTLYFHSDRPGGMGSFDLYVSFQQSQGGVARSTACPGSQRTGQQAFILRIPADTQLRR